MSRDPWEEASIAAFVAVAALIGVCVVAGALIVRFVG